MAELTYAQRRAVLWLAGEEVPGTLYDSATVSTLRALEGKGLLRWMLWEGNQVGPRPYYVRPGASSREALDDYGPVLTDEGEALARELVRDG